MNSSFALKAGSNSRNDSFNHSFMKESVRSHSRMNSFMSESIDESHSAKTLMENQSRRMIAENETSDRDIISKNVRKYIAEVIEYYSSEFPVAQSPSLDALGLPSKYMNVQMDVNLGIGVVCTPRKLYFFVLPREIVGHTFFNNPNPRNCIWTLDLSDEFSHAGLDEVDCENRQDLKDILDTAPYVHFGKSQNFNSPDTVNTQPIPEGTRVSMFVSSSWGLVKYWSDFLAILEYSAGQVNFPPEEDLFEVSLYEADASILIEDITVFGENLCSVDLMFGLNWNIDSPTPAFTSDILSDGSSGIGIVLSDNRIFAVNPREIIENYSALEESSGYELELVYLFNMENSEDLCSEPSSSFVGDLLGRVLGGPMKGGRRFGIYGRNMEKAIRCFCQMTPSHQGPYSEVSGWSNRQIMGSRTPGPYKAYSRTQSLQKSQNVMTPSHRSFTPAPPRTVGTTSQGLMDVSNFNMSLSSSVSAASQAVLSRFSTGKSHKPAAKSFGNKEMIVACRSGVYLYWINDRKKSGLEFNSMLSYRLELEDLKSLINESHSVSENLKLEMICDCSPYNIHSSANTGIVLLCAFNNLESPDIKYKLGIVLLKRSLSLKRSISEPTKANYLLSLVKILDKDITENELPFVNCIVPYGGPIIFAYSPSSIFLSHIGRETYMDETISFKSGSIYIFLGCSGANYFQNFPSRKFSAFWNSEKNKKSRKCISYCFPLGCISLEVFLKDRLGGEVVSRSQVAPRAALKTPIQKQGREKKIEQIKEKISQAIYYGSDENNPIEFVKDIGEASDVESSIIDISHSILNCKFKDLVLENEGGILAEKRLKFLLNLREFLETLESLPSISQGVRFELLCDIERSESCLWLSRYYEIISGLQQQNLAPSRPKILEESVKALHLEDKDFSGPPTVKNFLAHNVAKVGDLVVKIGQFADENYKKWNMLEELSKLSLFVEFNFNILNLLKPICYRGETLRFLKLDVNIGASQYDFWTSKKEIFECLKLSIQKTERKLSDLRANSGEIALFLENDFIEQSESREGKLGVGLDIEQDLDALYTLHIDSATLALILKRQLSQMADLLLKIGNDCFGLTTSAADSKVLEESHVSLFQTLEKLGMLNDAFSLAEKYQLYGYLVALVEKHSRERHTQYDIYLQNYQIPFANELYSYLINRKNYSSLFALGGNHAEFLRNYLLREHPDLLWIHHMKHCHYKEASAALLKQSMDELDLESKVTLLSFGKLANCLGKNAPEDVREANEFDAQLKYLDIVINIPKLGNLNSEKIEKLITDVRVQYPELSHIYEDNLKQLFLNKKILPLEHMIDVYTMSYLNSPICENIFNLTLELYSEGKHSAGKVNVMDESLKSIYRRAILRACKLGKSTKRLDSAKLEEEEFTKLPEEARNRGLPSPKSVDDLRFSGDRSWIATRYGLNIDDPKVQIYLEEFYAENNLLGSFSSGTGPSPDFLLTHFID